MTKEYTKYVIEGRPKGYVNVPWRSYEHKPFNEDELQGAIDEVTFYRQTHKQHEFRIVLRHFVTTDTITEY